MKTIELTKLIEFTPISINPEFIVKYEALINSEGKETGTVIYFPGSLPVKVKEAYNIVKANLRNI